MDIREQYFKWIVNKIYPTRFEATKYDSLLRHLMSIVFVATIEMDNNRCGDGIYLRRTFCWENDYPTSWADLLGTNECTVLEMMAALAIRCETTIMADSRYGDRTWLWFTSMIKNLKLETMTNERFDPEWVNYRIDILINHKYESDGTGGLFYVAEPVIDMRTVEIWMQLNWWLNEYIGGN